MKKCLIIGGGLAGLSSAVFLSQKGFSVELIEASPKLGGRTYSFLDKDKKTEIDNGQHILMGSYVNTFEFLKIIGAESIPEYQPKLKVEYYKKDGIKYLLKSPHKIYPLNLIQALLNFKAVSFNDRIKALKVFVDLARTRNDLYSEKTVKEYLTEKRQSQNAISAIWELLTVSALNTNLNEASANLFLYILKRLFLEGNKSSTIVLPKVPLSKLFIKPSEDYFKDNNIKYSCSEMITSLIAENNKITNVITTKREVSDFDFLVLAIPHHSIGKINSNFSIVADEIINIETSSIITIHIWLKKKIIINKFAGFIDSKIHWIFNNDSHLSIVISAADQFVMMQKSEIFDLVINELELYLNDFSKECVRDYKVIKEKRATFKCTLENEKLRSKVSSSLENLTLAGDWTNTNLPGTIEGAIQSGKFAAAKIFEKK